MNADISMLLISFVTILYFLIPAYLANISAMLFSSNTPARVDAFQTCERKCETATIPLPPKPKDTQYRGEVSKIRSLRSTPKQAKTCSTRPHRISRT